MCKDLVEKLESENYAIWNLIEVLSFGDFVRLYTLYDREYGNHNKGLIQCLYAVRCLRNAAAHNNCLLNSLRLPYTRKIHSSYSISRAVSQIPNGPKTTSREKKLANPVIHDFVAMLYVYKKIVSSPRTAEHFTKELHDLFDIRMNLYLWLKNPLTSRLELRYPIKDEQKQVTVFRGLVHAPALIFILI